MLSIFLMAGLTLVPGPSGNYIGVQVDNQYQYVVKAQVQTEYVNAGDGLYVRSEPSAESEKVGSLGYASSVDVVGTVVNSDWALIEWKDNYAFVCSDYIQEEKIEVQKKSAGNSDGNVGRYLGSYMVTAYEWTGDPCANGCYPTTGYTVACNSLPLGTHIYIEGVGERVVEDRGGGGSDWIDLYLGDPDACWNWGVKYRDVWIVD